MGFHHPEQQQHKMAGFAAAAKSPNTPAHLRAHQAKLAGGSMKPHPGFKAVQSSIATKEGISQDRAGAILASATRKASKSAKQKNPRLKKVKMPMHPMYGF